MRKPKRWVEYLIVYRLRIERRLTSPFSRTISAKSDEEANALYKRWKKSQSKGIEDTCLLKKIVTLKQLA